MKNYKITTYEETAQGLHLIIQSDVTPNAVEHWFSSDEEESDETIKRTILQCAKRLEDADARYSQPIESVSKMDELNDLNLDIDIAEE